MKLRVKFSKKGPLKYIGHLDIMRYFQKAIRRSGIPICYTTGFSPHQIMSFAAPLGVGVESEGEYFDIEVESVTTAKEMIDLLNAQMAEGIVIEGMRILPDNVKNAMASIQAASYLVTLENADDFIFESDWIEKLLSLNEIVYTKEGKKGKGPVTRDIRPAIFELSLMDDGRLYMLIDASSAANLKPAAVVDSLYGLDGKQMPKIHVLRIDTFTRDDSGNLISLGNIGELF